jgi:hypothetical protein
MPKSAARLCKALRTCAEHSAALQNHFHDRRLLLLLQQSKEKLRRLTIGKVLLNS